MAKKEVKTDEWVRSMLKEIGEYDNFTEQGSDIKDINEALSSASKSGSGKVGYPEFTGVIDDFLIVIEDKASLDKHIQTNDDGLISEVSKSVKDYAVNGALFYGKHLAKNTNYKKVLALGISGNEKNHKITPLFIDEYGDYKQLEEIDSLDVLSKNNINIYYKKEVLKEETIEEITTEQTLKVARQLHEDLRNYGSLEDKSKPIIVSGILLALSEIEYKNFSIDSLNQDKNKSDGTKIYEAIKSHVERSNVSPKDKKEILLSSFEIFKTNAKINKFNQTLNKSPLKHFTEILHESIFKSIKLHSSSEDYLGRFYGEFMSYSGGDGQTLGIILTPKHITELFCDLLKIKPSDKVLDPCCGTAGFLIAAMHYMLSQTDDDFEIREIKKNSLFGLELQEYMFTIATTNMILRGDGKSNLINEDFLSAPASELQKNGFTVGMMNPPYSQGSNDNVDLYEINFIKHLLDSMTEDGRVAVIVPQSTFTGKSKEERHIKKAILKSHTLEGVITLNKNTFYGVGTNPCIGIFTAGVPHNKNKKVKFINFENDGYFVSKHIGLIDNGTAAERKQYLLDVWDNKVEATSKFCVESTIEADDEWLHSFYYFDDTIPSDEQFEEVLSDYITFEVNMISHGREYLVNSDNKITNVKDSKSSIC